MKLDNGLGHLTYSTLVHPGDTWDEMWRSLQTYLPRVKERISPEEPFGVCLRLSAASAHTLAGDAQARSELGAFLDSNDLYVYTVNAFPYGPFKGQRVKEQVYEPDWRTPARVQYTIEVAEILAEIAPASVDPSIQTAPLGFKPNVTSPDVVAAYTRNVLGVAAHLVELEARTGRTVTLAIEPEPYCFLETTDETIDYFTNHLYSGAAARTLAELARIPVSDATVALRRHLGIVFDTCHLALEYEDMAESLEKLVDAGVPIFKLQEAAALKVPEVTEEAVEMLTRFGDTVYLTQTMQRRDGRITRFLNLEDALSSLQSDPGPREWRVHFHVPVFLDDLGPFRTTRDAISDALEVHRRQPLSAQLEIETYTWDVLPDEFKTGDIVDYVCRELEWVKGVLEGVASPLA